MDQAKRLKLGAIFFTIFWIGGMLWWGGEYHPAYIILLAVCGSIGGYLWHLAMRCACSTAIMAAAARRRKAVTPPSIAASFPHA